MKVAIIGSTHAGVFAAKEVLAQNPNAEVHIYEKKRYGVFSFLWNCPVGWESRFKSRPDVL